MEVTRKANVAKTIGLLNRESLLRKQELRIEKVELSKTEFVYVREMTGHERDIWERSLFEVENDNKGRAKVINRQEDFRAKLAVCTVCDEKGDLLLKPTDVMTLSINMGAAWLEKIVNKAQELNKISSEDKEQLIKNSDGDPVASSSSDSVKS